MLRRCYDFEDRPDEDLVKSAVGISRPTKSFSDSDANAPNESIKSFADLDMRPAVDVKVPASFTASVNLLGIVILSLLLSFRNHFAFLFIIRSWFSSVLYYLRGVSAS